MIPPAAVGCKPLLQKHSLRCHTIRDVVIRVIHEIRGSVIRVIRGLLICVIREIRGSVILRNPWLSDQRNPWRNGRKDAA